MSTSFFEAALFDELQPLYPDSACSQGKGLLQNAAATGTFAGVHILLTGLTPGKFVTVKTAGPVKKTEQLQGDKTTVHIAAEDSHYKLFQLLPLPVEVNTGAVTRTEWTRMDTNANVIRRAPFLIYDVLRPCTNVLEARGTVLALAFRCKVSASERELQKWEFTVTSDGISRQLTFEVDAFPVTVPEADKDDCKYINWFSYQGIAEYHHAPLHSDEWYTMFEKYLRLGKYGRQNMALLPAELFFDTEKGKGPKLNKAKLDRLVAILDRVGIYWIEGGHLAGRKDNEWEAAEAELQLTRRVIPGDGEAELSDMSRQIYEYVKKRHLEKRWIQSFMDEPIDCLSKTYRLGIDLMKAAMPGIRFLEATIATESIAGTVDHWCPTVDEYEKHREFFDCRVQKGDGVFVYTCLNPGGNYCNRLLDQERLRPVYLGWSPALYDDVEGYLHWGGMSMQRLDFYHLSAPLPDITEYDASRQGCLPAGDAAIMFPGPYQVYSSTRLEANRIGFEDLVLLKRLKAVVPDQVQKIVSLVFRAYDDYEKDVEVYRRVRKCLLETAERELG